MCGSVQTSGSRSRVELIKKKFKVSSFRFRVENKNVSSFKFQVSSSRFQVENKNVSSFRFQVEK